MGALVAACVAGLFLDSWRVCLCFLFCRLLLSSMHLCVTYPEKSLCRLNILRNEDFCMYLFSATHCHHLFPGMHIFPYSSCENYCTKSQFSQQDASRTTSCDVHSSPTGQQPQLVVTGYTLSSQRIHISFSQSQSKQIGSCQ